MIFSVYSFISGVIFSSLIIVIICIMHKRLDIFSGYNLYPMLFSVIFAMMRLVFAIEFSWTREIEIGLILPVVQAFLQDYISFGLLPMRRYVLLIAVSSLFSTYLLLTYFKSLWIESKRLQKLQTTDNNRLISLMEEVISETNLRKPYVIVIFPEVNTPVICGLRKPIIMMPEISLKLSDNDIRAIFRHELQHFINKDLWIKLIFTVIGCIMWWNPFIFIFKRNLKKIMEIKCDIDTTKKMNSNGKLEYMKSLCNVRNLLLNEATKDYEPYVSMSFSFTGVSVENMKDTDDLHHRLQMILPFEKRNHVISIACCAVILVLFLASYGFVIQPRVPAPEEDFWYNTCVEDYVVIKGETSPTEDMFVKSHEDGTLSLYFHGAFIRYIENEAELEYMRQKIEVFGDIPIIPFTN